MERVKNKIINKMNQLGASKVPFLFIIDYKNKQPVIYPLDSIPEDVCFQIPMFTNCHPPMNVTEKTFVFEKIPMSFDRYQKAFDEVQFHLKRGDSYLLNLTFPTEINTDLSLKEIFDKSSAPYKLLYKNKFVCFSPEIFMKITGGKLSSYPMKGTIDADIPDAEKMIMDDVKELAEHTTIVDLIRNDMSKVARNVKVNRFRYIDKVNTNYGKLLQVSSEICGDLEEGYASKIGDIIYSMLPAGSISGAPKSKTLEIIEEAEQYERGYYTGVFGVFDGENLESGVMIRYIEKVGEQYFYKSGGGVTSSSDLRKEYKELNDKVYVSFD